METMLKVRVWRGDESMTDMVAQWPHETREQAVERIKFEWQADTVWVLGTDTIPRVEHERPIGYY